MLAALGRRLARKLKSLVPLAVGSVVLFAVLWGLGQAVTPLLPADLRAALALLESGDLERARDDLEALLDRAPFPPELAFVGLQVAQVIVAPIPGQLVGLVAGYLFGFWLGLALSMVGLAVGTFLAIGLARLLGEGVGRRFLPRRHLEKFDALVGGGGLWNFFLVFLLPVFPDDAACFLAGLTRLPILGLVAVAVLGRLPGMAVLAFVGASAGEGSTAAYVVLGVALALSVVLWLFSEELEAWVERRTGHRFGDDTEAGPDA
ncbi:MAG TPA: VTT domain-containing protein [Anaeromyxobacteraceae bacterium]|nr:VTT domain-containing protein [Anaeromyxobacteraceae bacterium]